MNLFPAIDIVPHTHCVTLLPGLWLMCERCAPSKCVRPRTTSLLVVYLPLELMMEGPTLIMLALDSEFTATNYSNGQHLTIVHGSLAVFVMVAGLLLIVVWSRDRLLYIQSDGLQGVAPTLAY